MAYYKLVFRTDLDIYKRLKALQDELLRMASTALSPAAATALRAAAGVIGRLANGLFRSMDKGK